MPCLKSTCMDLSENLPYIYRFSKSYQFIIVRILLNCHRAHELLHYEHEHALLIPERLYHERSYRCTLHSYPTWFTAIQSNSRANRAKYVISVYPEGGMSTQFSDITRKISPRFITAS